MVGLVAAAGVDVVFGDDFSGFGVGGYGVGAVDDGECGGCFVCTSDS